jgi:hypothetical protein
VLNLNLSVTLHSERDLETLLVLLRDWQRRCDGDVHAALLIFGTMRSEEEVQALLNRVGLKNVKVQQGTPDQQPMTVH